MRKFFTISFLLIICIQFLPIKEMGKCLFDNQFVEEEVCKKGIEKAKSTEPGKDLVFFELSTQYIYIQGQCFSREKTSLHKPPITDIIAPPPNA
jgi:hypothetical protein